MVEWVNAKSLHIGEKYYFLKIKAMVVLYHGANLNFYFEYNLIYLFTYKNVYYYILQMVPLLHNIIQSWDFPIC